MANVKDTQVGGAYAVVGIHNQASTPVFGDILYYATTDITPANNLNKGVTGSAYVNLQSTPIRHEVDRKSSRNQAGHESLILLFNSRLVIDVTAFPEGTTTAGSTGPANALLSMKLPAAGGFCKLENFPVVAAFGQSDIFNSSDWLYEGGASIEPVADDRWGIRFTLTRYIDGGIAAQVVH